MGPLLEKPSMTQEQNIYVTENSVIHIDSANVNDGFFRSFFGITEFSVTYMFWSGVTLGFSNSELCTVLFAGNDKNILHIFPLCLHRLCYWWLLHCLPWLRIYTVCIGYFVCRGMLPISTHCLQRLCYLYFSHTVCRDMLPIYTYCLQRYVTYIHTLSAEICYLYPYTVCRDMLPISTHCLQRYVTYIHTLSAEICFLYP
jgi:hypothetical protein